MAAPYCTITGTIPGGQSGKATVRITPDVDGATATLNGTEVSMREYLVTSDSAGSIRVEILAPGNGVNPGGNWTHTVEIKTPDGVTSTYPSSRVRRSISFPLHQFGRLLRTSSSDLHLDPFPSCRGVVVGALVSLPFLALSRFSLAELFRQLVSSGIHGLLRP